MFPKFLSHNVSLIQYKGYYKIQSKATFFVLSVIMKSATRGHKSMYTWLCTSPKFIEIQGSIQQNKNIKSNYVNSNRSVFFVISKSCAWYAETFHKLRVKFSLCYEILLLKLLQSRAKAPLTHRPPHFHFISPIHHVCLPTPECFIFSLPCLPLSVCNKLNEILRHFPGAEAVCQAALTGPGSLTAFEI